MFSLEYSKDNLTAKFDAMPQKLHDALLKRVHYWKERLRNHVIKDKLQGQVLNHITGRLQGSIQGDVTDTPEKITGRVYSANTASPYNKAQEYGAVIPDRFPVNAKALHFFVGGQEIFAKRAKGFTLKERSYLRSSLADYKQLIINDMSETGRKAVA